MLCYSITLVAFDYSPPNVTTINIRPQSYALAHESNPKAVQNLQKCTRGAPRGVRGVILFSELHLNFFSQNFWGFGGYTLGCVTCASWKVILPYKVKLPENLSTSSKDPNSNYLCVVYSARRSEATEVLCSYHKSRPLVLHKRHNHYYYQTIYTKSKLFSH